MIHWLLEVNLVKHVRGKCNKKNCQNRLKHFWSKLLTDFNSIKHAQSLAVLCIVVVKSRVLSWWRHQLKTFSTSLALCDGNPPVTGGFPSHQWHGALMFSLICAWTHGWANNRDAGELRRHRAHYDVTVMVSTLCSDDLAQSVAISYDISLAIWNNVILSVKTHPNMKTSWHGRFLKESIWFT